MKNENYYTNSISGVRREFSETEKKITNQFISKLIGETLFFTGLFQSLKSKENQFVLVKLFNTKNKTAQAYAEAMKQSLPITQEEEDFITSKALEYYTALLMVVKPTEEDKVNFESAIVVMLASVVNTLSCAPERDIHGTREAKKFKPLVKQMEKLSIMFETMGVNKEKIEELSDKVADIYNEIYFPKDEEAIQP